MVKYVLTGTVRGKRAVITKPASKRETLLRKKNIQKELSGAIPKYRWVKNIRVVKMR